MGPAYPTLAGVAPIVLLTRLGGWGALKQRRWNRRKRIRRALTMARGFKLAVRLVSF